MPYILCSQLSVYDHTGIRCVTVNGATAYGRRRKMKVPRKSMSDIRYENVSFDLWWRLALRTDDYKLKDTTDLKLCNILVEYILFLSEQDLFFSKASF